MMRPVSAKASHVSNKVMIKTMAASNPKVTILVAVYNAQDFLVDCLDSVLAQSMPDFQCICIDDASTDGSLSILESYAQRDSRIEVIHLASNHGQAYARNQGLKEARGEYTCFLDSDDWLGSDAFERVVDAFERDKEVDCVLFRCRYVYPSASVEARIEDYPMPLFDHQVLTGSQAFEASLTWAIHGVYAVKTIIHKRFPYDDSAHSYSDDNTTRLHYLASRKVASCAGEYFYRQHESSVTHQVSIHRFDYLKANASMKAALVSLQVSERLIDIYENERWKNVVGMYLFYCLHRQELSDEDRREALRLIHEAWSSIETHRLFASNKYKLGFMPCRKEGCPHLLPRKLAWKLFRLQADFYFYLKEKLGRLNY